jgi:uncharacterized membrane protein YesL
LLFTIFNKVQFIFFILLLLVGLLFDFSSFELFVNDIHFDCKITSSFDIFLLLLMIHLALVFHHMLILFAGFYILIPLSKLYEA